MQVKCAYCGRMRSKKFMQEAVFQGQGDRAEDERYSTGAKTWRCAARETCKQVRKRARKA